MGTGNISDDKFEYKKIAFPSDVLLKIIELQNRIADANLEQPTIMQTIVEGACELVMADGAVVEFIENESMVYVAVSGLVSRDTLGLRLNIDGSLSGLCVGQDQILYCKDATLDPRVDAEACQRVGVRSMLVAPLRTTRSVIGVLKVFSKVPNFFKENDANLLTLVAGFFARSLQQAELAKSRVAQFEILANSLPQLTWIAEPDGSIRWFNERWYAFTGSSAQEMVAWGWMNAIGTDVKDLVLSNWLSAVTRCSNFEMVFPIKSASGESRLFLSRAIPIKDLDGGVLSWFGTCTDIDDQKRTEAELRESRKRYATLTESIPQLVWSCLPNGSCEYLSQQWCQYTGMDEKDQLGFDWLEKVIHPDDRIRTLEHWMGAVRGEHPYDIEYRIKSAQGEYRWFKTRGIPMLNEGKIHLWVGTCTDIHDQKLAADELIIAKDEAVRANNLKSAFLANMSHEIRTPLGAMMGFADLLVEPGLNSAEKANYAEVLRRNGEQLGRVINDILDLSKVETGHVTIEYMRTKPIQIAQEVISLMSVVANEKGITLSLQEIGQIPEEMVSDSLRAKQVLVNLINNALKFTKVGAVTLSISPFDTDDNLRGCHFDVTDTGIGIAEESVSKLFKMFNQADNSMTRKYGGTGLGLALSKSLAIAMGGDVILTRTQLDVGSNFRFSLPSRDDQLPSIDRSWSDVPSRSVEPLKSDALAGVKVLLVEDSPDNQQLIWRYLSKYGALIEIANNGFEGANKALSGEHDIVLMDIQMPVMDGYTSVGKLRMRGYQKPILALTAHAMADVRRKCRDVGFTDHLPKPINPHDLVKSILKNLLKG